METKLSQLLTLMRAEQWTEALAVAASFPSLGAHELAIKRAHECGWRASFYRQLGMDPGALKQAGIAALKARYARYLSE